jgi:hypothetical protein
MDTYDQRVYAIGKGPTKLTMEAPMSGVTVGSDVIVRGMVTDISPGTQTPEIAMRFPNGVPAVADDSMSEWMLYVYKQFEQPMSVSGVTVIFSAVDPDGNYMDLNRVTSDGAGYYSFAFKPEKEGIYTIIATFEGSEAYYGSFAETSIVVGSAPTTATPIEPEQPEPEVPVEPTETVETPMITTEIAAVIGVAAVAVIAAVVFVLLRRRK